MASSTTSRARSPAGWLFSACAMLARGRWAPATTTPVGLRSFMKFAMDTPNNGGSVTTAGGMNSIGAALDRFLRGFDTETGALPARAAAP